MAMEQSASSSSPSFSSLRAYGRALVETPKRVARRATSATTTFEEMSRIRPRSGSEMHKSLKWFDLVGLGIGGMVGAGIFVTTGHAYRDYAGPAVILSYAIAGICALLSAFCYTEFAVDMPVAGGAFSYLRVTFGEFAAFLTGANLVMEYVFSNAAVARSLTAYLGAAIGIPLNRELRIVVSVLPKGFNEIDFLAVAVIFVISLCICYSTKESSVLNMVLTAIHIAFIVFVIVYGFCEGDWKNYTRPLDPKHPGGFFPYGIAGVFQGASLVYLSYIGYDAVSTMAEEVRNPTKDIPIGVSGSVILVTIFYCLMAGSMAKLVPYDAIDAEAPFANAFQGSKAGWASKLIGAGASFGILTSLLVSMLGQARYLCVIGRSNVVPSWFAKVHPKTSTPVNATAFLGGVTAAIALFTDLGILLNLVSIGTLFVFYMVANAVIYRRYVSGENTRRRRFTLYFLLLFTGVSLCFTLAWKFVRSGNVKLFLLGGCTVVGVALVELFHLMVPQARKPEFWGVPLMPWIPCTSIFLNVFLLGSLDRASFVRFGIFSGVVVMVYLFYSVHSTYDAYLKDQSSGEEALERPETEPFENFNVKV